MGDICPVCNENLGHKNEYFSVEGIEVHTYCMDEFNIIIIGE